MKITLLAALAAASTLGAVSASAQSYTYGSGALLFDLNNLPTGPSGTQAAYGPNQDYTATPLGAGANIAGTQGVLNQTVGGVTLSFRTPDAVYSGDTFTPVGATPTAIWTENESTNFGYLGVPAGVQVGLFAYANGQTPAPVIVNSTSALSYFSINVFRVNSGAGPGSPFPVSSTITAYSGLNGTGDVLGTITGGVTGGMNFGYSTLALTGLTGAQSFTLQGAAGVSPRYDDITATVFAAAPVPEVATWAMMMVGFGLAGTALRRRRTTVSFA